MIIYIRHANDDANKSSAKYRYDPHITKLGTSQTKKLTNELVKKYGFPTQIYSGPFNRCRDTMSTMVDELVLMKTGVQAKCNCRKCYKGNIKIETDVNLAKHSKHLDNSLDKVSPKTLKYNIPKYETEENFNNRIDNHLAKMKEYTQNISNGPAVNNANVIWCITHAYIYKHIAGKLNINTSNHIEFLDYFVYYTQKN